MWHMIDINSSQRPYLLCNRAISCDFKTRVTCVKFVGTNNPKVPRVDNSLSFGPYRVCISGKMSSESLYCFGGRAVVENTIQESYPIVLEIKFGSREP